MMACKAAEPYEQCAPMAQRILIIEDEPDMQDLLVLKLNDAGFQTVTASTGSTALRKAAAEHPDLIVLDLMLPEMSGVELCRRFRSDGATAGTPIIIVSAKTDEVDKIVCLELGADDYLTKPFSPRELVLRIRKLLLRKDGKSEQHERMAVGELAIDRAMYRVSCRGQDIALTATEFKLLAILMERCGRVQTRERLLNDVWDYADSIDTRTVDTHMRRLREKLGECSRYIETVRGVGYRLAGPNT
jgi:DNA-binding response OmpR family regulator